MRSLKTSPFLLMVLLAAICCPDAATADDWLPISKEDLAMKDYAPSPGAHAVMLYREVRTDDQVSYESHYYRIKILHEEGKKQANVEITFLKGITRIDGLKARTIRPDGTAVKFEGEVFEKTVVKSRGLKFLAKTFSFPEVQVGSIIEYRFNVRWEPTIAYSPDWFLEGELPTRRAVFYFKPYAEFSLAWTSARLPEGVAPREGRGRIMEMSAENIPAFEEEDMAPPENELKSWVRFYYVTQDSETSEKYWRQVGVNTYKDVQGFIGKRKGIEQAVAQLITASDSPEEKLRKIYASVQKIRNLSYEREKSEKEEKREKLKDNNNVEDVMKNGYGYRGQINRLFVAMARAAGFEAEVLPVSERDVQFFMEKLLTARQFDGEVSIVKIDGQDRFFDPGMPHCPFGMLSWLRTGVRGLRLDKDGGAFFNTPHPTSESAIVKRVGNFTLNEEGGLTGTVDVSFIGQEAISRRLSTRDEDDAGRHKEIEDEIKGWLPNGATVKIESITGWTGFAEPLRVKASVEVSGFASSAGRRLLVPTNVLTASGKNPFSYAKRKHPVYLRNPYREVDEVTVTLPEGYKVESVPAPRESAPPYGKFQIKRVAEARQLKLTRNLIVEGYFFPLQYYPSLRTFFNTVRTGDDEQVVLQAATAASN